MPDDTSVKNSAGSFQVAAGEGLTSSQRSVSFFKKLIGFVGGVVFVGIIGFCGDYLAKHVPIQLSALLYATGIGIVIGNVTRVFDPEMTAMKPMAVGMTFAKQRLLRVGIILYGAKITFNKILSIGLAGLITDLYAVLSSVFIGLGLGRFLGLSAGLRTLVTTGSAICGCSAVVATQGVVNAEAHEVSTAVGVVVLCGTIAMFLYPLLFQVVPAFAEDPRLMGIYTGATVHELAGVVAASNAMGAEVANTAIVAKLLRVFMLAPWVIIVDYFGIGQKDGKPSTGAAADGFLSKFKGVPWFAFGFVGVAAYNSVWPISPSLQKTCELVSASCLSSAMAALGLDTNLIKVISLGWRPIAVALVLWINLLLAGSVVAQLSVYML